jgi:hypothetical protein
MTTFSRRAGLVLPCAWLVACTIQSSSANSRSSSSDAGCGGGGGIGFGGGGAWDGVNGAPDRGDPNRFGPSEPAPTGMQWKPIETDEGCGRSGLSWVLVDEVCGDGDAVADPRSLETPMFRDGALVGDHLLTVDGTHLWSLDLGGPGAPARTALVTGLGQPLAVAARASRVFVAAGLDGLVVVDAADPARPRRASGLALPHPAFDVFLDDDEAFVAMGGGGVAVASIAAVAPSLTRTLAVPGLAAGVAVDASHAYVAACSTFAVVDRATGKVKASAWVPQPYSGDRLVAPAKDVALVGSVAFVAAGKLGAVAIDVSVPTAPKVLGSCRVDEPSFYASGVRAEGTSVFVAGGEWGVLHVDASNPMAACTSMVALPEKPPPAETDCSSQPPWEVVPWEEVWAPPPPGKDPIQVLPAGDRVFAFGDARRIGVRAVDVRAASPSLELLSRYDEPRTLLGIAAREGRVVAVGPKGGVFALDAAGNLTRAASSDDAVLRTATAVAFASDGRWIALAGEALHVEGREAPIALGWAPTSLASRGSEIVVAGTSDIEVFDLEGHQVRSTQAVGAHLPLALAADANAIWFAAPEWTEARRLSVAAGSDATGQTGALLPHEIFDHDDAMDARLWRARVPRRHLAASPRGIVEVAGLGRTAGLVVHGSKAIERTAVPALTYVGLATDAGHAYLVGIDRGLYKSYLVTVSLASAKPRVVSVEAFTGAASGVSAAAGRVFVADADGALRTYSVSGTEVHPASVLRVEVTP